VVSDTSSKIREQNSVNRYVFKESVLRRNLVVIRVRTEVGSE
jgi:hypothetical protein